MNRTILFWSITVALGGFLFGFDTVVISGADLALQRVWPSSPEFHGGIIMSSALWGTVVGAVLGSIPTDRLGRKKTLIWIGLFFFVSAVGSGIATGPWEFAFYRFLGGLGVGVSTIASPGYVSEIAPASSRGRLVALYQFNIVLGILVAYLSNYLLKGISEQDWRWMLGIEAVPALLYTIMVFLVPESPRWQLMKNKDVEGATKTLSLLYPPEVVKTEVQRMLSESEQVTRGEHLFQKKYAFPVMLAFLIAFFNQFSGINAFLYYAPRIFTLAGLEESAALLTSVGIGVTNLAFTLLGLSLIDKFGRKQLMYIGSLGYIISLGCVALTFWMNIKGMMVPIFLFLFIASHAIGQGTVIWVFISEIFPTHLRAAGQALGSSVHWVLAAAIPSTIPWAMDAIGPASVFLIFTIMMVFQLLFVWRMMPETKGVPLEELEKQLIRE